MPESWEQEGHGLATTSSSNANDVLAVIQQNHLLQLDPGRTVESAYILFLRTYLPIDTSVNHPCLMPQPDRNHNNLRIPSPSLPCTAKGQEYIWIGLGLAKPERLTCQRFTTGSYGSRIENKLFGKIAPFCKRNLD